MVYSLEFKSGDTPIGNHLGKIDLALIFENVSNRHLALDSSFIQHHNLSGAFKAYRFKTQWILLELGTNNFTEENGWVLISEDGRQMEAYHFWGE